MGSAIPLKSKSSAQQGRGNEDMATDAQGRTYLNAASPKRELFDALKLQVDRAECAEARIADLLEENREQAEANETLRAELQQARAERDAAEASLVLVPVVVIEPKPDPIYGHTFTWPGPAV